MLIPVLSSCVNKLNDKSNGADEFCVTTYEDVEKRVIRDFVCITPPPEKYFCITTYKDKEKKNVNTFTCAGKV